jgi:type IV pilus assembly protein PilV
MSMNKQRGFTLIEILVAMLILTVGILGVAAMQLVSFQTNQSAYSRSQATYLAQDMFDRIRANPDGYNNTTIYDDIDGCDAGSIPVNPACISSAAGCSPQATAEQDIREWTSNFINNFALADWRPVLPNGCATIVRAVGTNNFTATITWDEKDWDDGATDRAIQSRSVIIQATVN